MNKKRHQDEPNAGDSTESCDENQNMAECTHIHKSVDLSKMKKGLIKTGIVQECAECKDAPEPPNEDEMIGDLEFDTSLWLCLKCGNQACGRARNKHALKHYNTPHSDKHSLCVNTTHWGVWCYECDDDINASCRKKLLEAVEYTKKQVEGKQNYSPAVNKVLEVFQTLPPIILTDSAAATPVKGTVPRARGLTNLGNTCFFNSVMQCLGQTPYLLNLLEETSVLDQPFKLPGGVINPEDKNSPIAEPIEGTLEKWRQLTSTLAETLRELQSGRAEVYNPRMLLSKLTQRMPQFGGGDQHDSHELLRHLLEAVREEDLKRYQAEILKNQGLRKVDPSTVDDALKKKIKFYGQQAEQLLPTEQVFRGVLVSTLQCQDCEGTSHRDEFFLDLSLPITEKQIPPVLRRKAEDLEDNKPSKHQIKKEKRAERKKNKKQKSYKNINSALSTNFSVSSDANIMEASESESDADVEDNVEEAGNLQNDDSANKGMESGYNSDKVENSSPDSNNRGGSPADMGVDDSGVPSPAVGMLSVISNSPENSPSSSEINMDLDGNCGRNSPVDEPSNDFNRPESRLAFANRSNTDLKVDLAKLSLLNDADSNKAVPKELEGACAISDDEKMDEDAEEEDSNLWTGTISARYQCEEGECSIQSCLNQFTTCELMSGNNRVGCETCTKREGGPDKKTIYTNATKQLLIYNPPAVLILHLKRFQVCRFRSAKVSKFVKFPTLLDLAPFCSKRSRNLPSFEENQTKVLYSLYGVVEHSGSMHGGHYVAYVKVRPQLDENHYRWQFLPRNQSAKAKVEKGAEGIDPQEPAGKWYYISDSYVQEVNETKVLEAQAYLLFYERIM